MQPIHFALSEIRERIPEEILDITFKPKLRFRENRHRFSESTIEQQILEKVINGRVRKYVDSLGAQEVTIPLDGLTIDYHDTSAWSCHIPKSRTKGRSITQAISVHIGYHQQIGNFGYVGMGGSGINVRTNHSGQCGNNQAIQMARTIMNANKPTELNYSANVYLIDENTIYCDDRMSVINLVLRCMVASDSEFSFIQGAYVQDFADLCVLATEAYIARNKKVVLDKAAIEGGMEIGVIREYVDKYADSDEAFREMVKTRWRKIQRLADKPRAMAFADMLIAPGS